MNKKDPINTDDLIGSIIDEKYKVVEKIGSGASAIVYKVRNVQLRRSFALKILSTDHNPDPKQNTPEITRELRERFEYEHVLAAPIHHRSCNTPIDIGEYEDRPYLVFPFIPGNTLRMLILNGAIAYPRAKQILRTVLQGLHELHKRGTVHRDIKPENIMIPGDKSIEETYGILIDFGLAKRIKNTGHEDLMEEDAPKIIMTRSNTPGVIQPGTPEYSDYSRLEVSAISLASDLYSLTLTFIEMLLGSTVIYDTKGNLLKIAVKQLQVKQHVDWEKLKVVIPKSEQEDMFEIINLALEMKYENANEMLKAVQSVGTPKLKSRPELERQDKTDSIKIADFEAHLKKSEPEITEESIIIPGELGQNTKAVDMNDFDYQAVGQTQVVMPKKQEDKSSAIQKLVVVVGALFLLCILVISGIVILVTQETTKSEIPSPPVSQKDAGTEDSELSEEVKAVTISPDTSPSFDLPSPSKEEDAAENKTDEVADGPDAEIEKTEDALVIEEETDPNKSVISQAPKKAKSTPPNNGAKKGQASTNNARRGKHKLFTDDEPKPKTKKPKHKLFTD